ncbi:MAG: hypothetical protein SAK29_32645 [Scytonema sp. PMC 1069.18]|nr:hypothetical protein [Scytonema sp. PMC 1069.18]MEC4888175.1 hypothetical protein [Scytonema sp. PMC 1070.18]
MLKEALCDSVIARPGGWLKTAIEQGWKPNGKIKIKSELELFTERYPKATPQKLLQASQNTRDGITIFTNDEK